MNSRTIFKIKDSVDLFLSNEKYIIVYFMNSRQRKSFRVNDDMLRLFELIDGEKDVQTLQSIMHDDFEIDPECTSSILTALLRSKIITEVVKEQNILPDNLVRRYSRQINYFSEFLEGEIEGIKAQKKLMDTHILVFGCGAIGGNIAMELAMAGIGHISLYDYDIVDESDISRHIFYRDQYLGQPKVKALEAELKAVNSEIQVVTYNDSMKPTSDIEKIIETADFIVNTLDEPYIGYTASKIFSKTERAKELNLTASDFSMNTAGGRCECCQGTGKQKIELTYLPETYITCPECKGYRFKKDVLSVKYNGYSINDILNTPISKLMDIFYDNETISGVLQCVIEIGLGYLSLGQMSMSLSGGEAQRIKLAKSLSVKSRGNGLYILDEPTSGLNDVDIQKVEYILNRLSKNGETILIIEHNLEFIARIADYLVDLGCVAGDNGGKTVIAGDPKKVISSPKSSWYFINKMIPNDN